MSGPKIIENLDQYREWVQQVLVPSLSDREVLLLTGPVGVGKTQLVRYLVEALGAHEACSPSFAIHNCYEVIDRRIDHVDLYRLEDEQDLESTGFWDFFLEPRGLIIIEWAERLDSDYLPPGWTLRQVDLAFIDEGQESQRRSVNLLELRPRSN
ncbi:MAG: tRNA (adenosine(37)-N6)-threonylcarbamoyltransferase complex ATPase subunit type 1 TsaE [Bdellovibrionaceae bacterium]|nr:tRNA (adenosine(37)-N6)-threonylcarbamoyltransferase complex ATPase subunit type 1 TsaE [Bdellovibrionales bacterium]MCB9083917.1 tRNA (adenosine(37)-N6)-threonylcarbamoyltransferase complex ATPase subunit type 1 TsaE [Pseudobdellovibrionaceae bacterium]